MEPLDVPKGLGAGLGTQLVLIPLAYVLIFWFADAIGWDIDHDLSGAGPRPGRARPRTRSASSCWC